MEAEKDIFTFTRSEARVVSAFEACCECSQGGRGNALASRTRHGTIIDTMLAFAKRN